MLESDLELTEKSKRFAWLKEKEMLEFYLDFISVNRMNFFEGTENRLMHTDCIRYVL